MGPVGAARIGYINGDVKLNPTLDEMKDSALDLVVAGTADAVLMVESEAKELSEDLMLKAVMAGHRGFQPVIEAIIRLAEKAAKEPRDLVTNDKGAVEAAVRELAEAELREAYKITSKQDRYNAVDAIKAKVFAALAPAEGEARFPKDLVAEAFHDLQAKVVRWNILDTRHPYRWARREDGATDPRAGGRSAAHPWFGPVHPRRNSGPRRRHARDRRRRAICRSAGGHL